MNASHAAEQSPARRRRGRTRPRRSSRAPHVLPGSPSASDASRTAVAPRRRASEVPQRVPRLRRRDVSPTGDEAVGQRARLVAQPAMGQRPPSAPNPSMATIMYASESVNDGESVRRAVARGDTRLVGVLPVRSSASAASVSSRRRLGEYRAARLGECLYAVAREHADRPARDPSRRATRTGGAERRAARRSRACRRARVQIHAGDVRERIAQDGEVEVDAAADEADEFPRVDVRAERPESPRRRRPASVRG